VAFSVERIRNEALHLSADERARLAGDLIDSLDGIDEVDQTAVDAAWRAEVRRRVEASREGRVELLNGDKVMEKMRHESGT
jgi:putative addiction module component (TIGR02574 family)